MNDINKRSNSVTILQPSCGSDDRTYIVFGLVRGGTSMVAGVLRGLGLDLGRDLPDNHEDDNFVTQDPGRSCLPLLERDAQLRELIAQRNCAKAVWGWKYPQAAEYLDDIWASIRNPHLICVFRDLSAVTMAHQRWHNKPALRALSDLNVNTSRNVSLLARVDCPRVMVSYERALRHPDDFVEQMSRFCGISINPSFDYKGFMQPEKYKNVEEFVSP